MACLTTLLIAPDVDLFFPYAWFTRSTVEGSYETLGVFGGFFFFFFPFKKGKFCISLIKCYRVITRADLWERGSAWRHRHLSKALTPGDARGAPPFRWRLVGGLWPPSRGTRPVGISGTLKQGRNPPSNTEWRAFVTGPAKKLPWRDPPLGIILTVPQCNTVRRRLDPSSPSPSFPHPSGFYLVL